LNVWNLIGPMSAVIGAIASTYLASTVAARISDLFTIKRGIATGANGFFLLTPEQIGAWGLPEKFLRPVLPRQQRCSRAKRKHPRKE
ncbi:MAG: hypothetical protein UV49_C0035G0009, partial [candidate division WWE3 bacterium GW2011_GWA2_42_9]